MGFETLGFWRTKAYKHEGVPSLEELQSFLGALKKTASVPTFALFDAAARMPPAVRVAAAMQTALDLLSENPHLAENRTASEIFLRTLTIEEKASFMEVAGIPSLNQLQRRTAEELLCIKDRGVIAHFLSKTFLSLKNAPYLRDMD